MGSKKIDVAEHALSMRIEWNGDEQWV